MNGVMLNSRNMILYVATHNRHKIREIGEILSGFEIVPDDPAGAVEDAPDFAGNALIKVRAIARLHPGEWCMADDSGLEVFALNGEPGILSSIRNRRKISTRIATIEYKTRLNMYFFTEDYPSLYKSIQ